MIKTSILCDKCKNSKYRGYKGKLFCPHCKNERRRSAYAKDVIVSRKKANDRRLRDPEKFRLRQKQYTDKNRDRILERRRQYYKDNPERFVKERENIHPLYSTWDSMKQRCFNKNNRAYKDYGGRGITVCERWKNSFDLFTIDMGGNKPDRNHSLERRDNNGDYEPDNCYWATKTEQQNNTRRTRAYRSSIPDNSPIYYPCGMLITLSEFAEKVNLPLVIAKYRYAQNFDANHILSHEYDNRRYEYKGHKYNMTELSLISGLKYPVISQRILYRGWTVEDAVEKKINPISRAA